MWVVVVVVSRLAWLLRMCVMLKFSSFGVLFLVIRMFVGLML